MLNILSCRWANLNVDVSWRISLDLVFRFVLENINKAESWTEADVTGDSVSEHAIIVPAFHLDLPVARSDVVTMAMSLAVLPVSNVNHIIVFICVWCFIENSESIESSIACHLAFIQCSSAIKRSDYAKWVIMSIPLPNELREFTIWSIVELRCQISTCVFNLKEVVVDQEIKV